MITFNVINYPSTSPVSGLPVTTWWVEFDDNGNTYLNRSAFTSIGTPIQMSVTPSTEYVFAVCQDQNQTTAVLVEYSGSPQDGTTYGVDFNNRTIVLQSSGGTIPIGGGVALDLSNLLPMPPNAGPPLPKIMQIYWPWYKGAKL